MGVGKTTIGKSVAATMGVPFYDTDCLVEKQSRQSISEIFSTKGEDVFRQHEANALQTLLGLEDIVVALGGGTLHYRDNFDIVLKNFVLVILEAPFDLLKTRLANRPLRSSAEALYRERKKVFACARQVVSVVDRSVDEISAACIQIWKAAA